MDDEPSIQPRLSVGNDVTVSHEQPCGHSTIDCTNNFSIRSLNVCGVKSKMLLDDLKMLQAWGSSGSGVLVFFGDKRVS